MADTKISALPSATTPLAGTEVVPLVQSSTTKNVAVSDLTAGRSVSGASFVPTGSSVPANGMYLSASNTVALSTNSTIRGLFDPNGNWSAGYSGSVTGVGNMFSNNDYTTAYAANLGANAANVGYGSQGTFRSGSNSSTTSGISLITRATGLSRWDILNVWTANYLGDLVFRARTGGSTTAEIVRFKSNTDVSIAAGNLVIGTSGKGIDFSANSHASGMTSETLTWYEEGTWTPSVGGTATYTAQVGHYTRIGRQVTVRCNLTINTIGTGSTFEISGLPFASGTGSGIAVSYFNDLNLNVTFVTGYINASGSAVNLVCVTTAAATITNAPNLLKDSSGISFFATYFV
jgi:hypothetical protein